MFKSKKRFKVVKVVGEQSQQDVDELNIILDEIILGRESWRPSDWAKESGLSESTCYRLVYRITLRPQFRTVCHMAAAVGLQVITNRRLAKQRRSA